MADENIGYSDAAAPSKASSVTEDAMPEKNDEDSENTALLPKSIFGDKKCEPGETISLRVVADHGEEIEVEPAEEKSDSDDSSEMDKAQNGLNGIAKEGEGY